MRTSKGKREREEDDWVGASGRENLGIEVESRKPCHGVGRVQTADGGADDAKLWHKLRVGQQTLETLVQRVHVSTKHRQQVKNILRNNLVQSQSATEGRMREGGTRVFPRQRDACRTQVSPWYAIEALRLALV
jgi:hypothetical protein